LRDHIDLAGNTRLRSIHLNDMMLHRQYSFDDTLLDWVPMILTQIISSQLEEARFSFSVNDIAELGVLDWAQVDHILGEQPRFSTLGRVAIVVNGKVDARATVESIKGL
jgi:hypothetical protein